MPTKIEWAEETWNPVTGCTKVSPGCKHCYAETMAERFRGTKAFPNGFDLTLKPERLDQPARWKKPRRIFVNSMSDLFHEDIPDAYIEQVYDVMLAANHHQYLILTKRPERMAALLDDGYLDDKFRQTGATALGAKLGDGWHGVRDSARHIWHGVSVESQEYVDPRVRPLSWVPSGVNFVSCEPLLGPVDLTAWSYDIDWVIVGGESGHGRRPFSANWAWDLLQQCRDHDIPFFMKQMDKVIPIPDSLMVREYPELARV